MGKQWISKLFSPLKRRQDKKKLTSKHQKLGLLQRHYTLSSLEDHSNSLSSQLCSGDSQQHLWAVALFTGIKKPTEEAGKTAVSISEKEMRQGDWLEAYGPYGLTWAIGSSSNQSFPFQRVVLLPKPSDACQTNNYFISSMPIPKHQLCPGCRGPWE